MSPEMERPRLSRRWGVASEADGRMMFCGETGETFVQSPALALLAPLLDGTRNVRALSAATAARLSPPEFWYALADGEARGLLRDAARDGAASAKEQAFFDRLGTAPIDAGTALAAMPVEIVALGGAFRPDTAPFREALRDAGIAVPDDPLAARLTLVLTDDYLRGDLLALSDRHLRERRAWMPVRPVGRTLFLGPVYAGAAGPCHRCLADRLERHREVARFVEEKAGRALCDLVPAGATATSLRLAASLTALELVRFALGDEGLLGQVMTVDLKDGTVALHRLTQRPQCAACGDPKPSPDAPPRLVARPTDDPGACVATSLARLRGLVGPVAGVVSRCYGMVDAARPDIHNRVAVHGFPMVRENIDVLAENLVGRSGGAAAGEEEAEISALGEAAERISGIWRGEEERRRRTTAAALGAAAIDLEACLLYSEAQYAGAKEWNAAQTAPRELVPRRLGRHEILDFTPVWSVLSGERRYLPSTYCYYGHPEAADPICYADSNGCAAGPSLEAAAASALVELVERDAVAIWWYNRLQRPALDLASFDLDVAMIAGFSRAGRDLTVLDLTNDIGIPVFAGVSCRLDHPREEILLGFGAHLDPALALKRVLRELNQFAFIAADRDGEGNAILRSANADMIRWLRHASRADHRHLAALEGRRRGAADFARLSSGDHREDVMAVAARLAGVGVEAFLLDQTRPDIGIPVMRAVAPGLRHFWRRLAPGRLADVPVALGWLDRPTAEEGLNPHAVFF